MTAAGARNYRVTLRDRLAHRLASLALATATPEYRKYVTYLWGTGKQTLDTEVAESHRLSEEAAALSETSESLTERDDLRSDRLPNGPLTREWAHTSPSDEGMREVVMIEPVWKHFVDSIYDRGLHIYPVPFGEPDSLPSYAVGVGSR